MTARKTTLRWYKEFVNGEMDEMTYVELCKKQNNRRVPGAILRCVLKELFNYC